MLNLNRVPYPLGDKVIRGGNLLAPDDFTGAPWTATNLTMTANATTAPDGSLTADLAVPTVTNTVLHYLTEINLTTSAVPYTFRIRAKPAAYQYCEIGIANSAGYTKYCYASFNLRQASCTDRVDSGGYIGIPSIRRLKDGWCLLEMSAITDANSTHRVEFYVSEGPKRQVAFAGNTFDGIYLWGAEFSPE